MSAFEATGFVASLITGYLAALAWVALWTVAFPGVWAGHGTLTAPIFVVGVFAVPAVVLWAIVKPGK